MTEYEKLRDEYMHMNSNMQQAVALALGSASVAIPLLLGQITNLSSSLIASSLHLLAIVYSVITLGFASSGYSIGVISKYIHGYIEPEVNRIVKSDAEHKLLYWETFTRRERRTLIGGLVANAGAAAFALMLLLPGAVSLVAAQYVLSSSGIQQVQQATVLQLPSFLLLSLSVVAWLIYALAVASVLLATVYNVAKVKWFRYEA